MFILFFSVFILNTFSHDRFSLCNCLGNHVWGITINSLKITEGVPDSHIIEEDGRVHNLVYNNRIFEGHSVDVLYQFFDNSLHYVLVTFQNINSLDKVLEVLLDLFNKFSNIYVRHFFSDAHRTAYTIYELWINHIRQTFDIEEYRFISWNWGHHSIYDSEWGVPTSIGILYTHFNNPHMFRIQVSYSSPDYTRNWGNIFGK